MEVETIERKDDKEWYKANPYIQTYTGKKFYFLTPTPDMVDILDIAHALSNLCRFGGHTKRYYSVAEHSIHVSRNVPKKEALEGLLHDATEAYLVDIPKPIKGFLGNYEEMENNIYKVIAEKFGLNPVIPESVKTADARMLFTEKQLLNPVDWGWELEPYDVKLSCANPELAKYVFLFEFNKLYNERNATK